LNSLLEKIREALGDRYDVESEVGAGGMCTVFRARDLKLDRTVALKVFRPELAAALGVERFLTEVRTSAQLNHPHILPLHDSGEADGLLYMVMPFVEGESLADRLAREPQLPVDEAIEIACEVLDALGYAHAQGLIHRDVKPGNIMLSEGHALLADFGISRAVDAAAEDRLTGTGVTVGTPAYMSPEQSSNVTNLDGRSDLYSLGCTLYEMLVGDVPFTGKTPQVVIVRHSMDQVPRPKLARETIPDDVEEAILKAMAKSPADRFRSAEDFREALRTSSGMVTSPTLPKTGTDRKGSFFSRGRVVGALAVLALVLGWAAYQGGLFSGGQTTVPGTGPSPNRLAVLYLDDLSEDDLGYLSAGITEGLIDRLKEVRSLDVVSKNGVAQFRGTSATRDSLVRALNVGSLVEGTVESIPSDQFRVTVRLVDAESGADIGREAFEFGRGDVLAVRDSVITSVELFLRRRLGEEVQFREYQAELARNPDAWIAFHRGEQLRKEAKELIAVGEEEPGRSAYLGADSMYQIAETADPDWDEPPAMRAEVWYRLSWLALADPAETEESTGAALAHAERALSIDDSSISGLEMRGTVRYFRWLLGLDPGTATPEESFAAARADLERVVALDPTRATAHSTLSHLYSQIPDYPAANLAAVRALEEDAYLDNAQSVLLRLFNTSYDMEHLAWAQRWCDEGKEKFPDDYRLMECDLFLMTTSAREADPSLAWEVLDRMVEAAPDALKAYQGLSGRILVGGILGRAGLADSARVVLEGAEIDPQADITTLDLLPLKAFAYRLNGDDDTAFDILRRYFASNPDHRITPDEEISWWWRGMEDDPRFEAFRMSG
jgi:serine/threonine-protein kinase